MLKKTITYTNFDDVSVSEDHYFNLTLAECTKMELGEDLSNVLGNIVKAADGKQILKAFEDIVRKAYGRREGDRFVKKSEYWEEFTQTEAWSSLFMEIATDAAKSIEFFKSILPAQAAQSFEAGVVAHPELGIIDDNTSLADFPVAPLSAADFASKDPEDMTVEEMLREMGVADEPVKVDYTKMSREQIRKLPKAELIEAMKQRNKK